MSTYSFGTEEMLLIRLLNGIKQGKKLGVLVGSGLTTANLEASELGVASTSDIAREIEQVFVSNNAHELFNLSVKKDLSSAERYQAAIQTMLSCFGQDELNKLIIKSVLNSMIDRAVISNNEKELNPEALEKEFRNWFLRPGLDALGELYVDFKEIFVEPLMTSNFDPLLEVSVRKHQGNPNSIFLVNDGKFLNQKSDANHSLPD